MTQPLPDTRPFAAFEWKLALRYLRARRKEGFISVISLFSFLGIMLGVATLIVVMSIFNGFHNELLSRVLGFSGHASIYKPDLTPIEDFVVVRDNIVALPFVKSVVPLVEGQVMVSSIKTASGALIRGISEDDIAHLASINNDKLSTALGQVGVLDAVPSWKGFDKSEGIAIGQRMAWKHQVGLGGTITLIAPNGPETVIGSTPRIRDYTVVAIFNMGMSDYDEGVAYLPLNEAQDFFSTDTGVTGIEINVDKPDNIAAMVGDLAKAAGSGLIVQTWRDRNQAFFTALTVERNMLFMVLTMIILVAALNIISGLIMLVKDKGRDIAILRTMGATAGAIQRIFFITGAAIGVIGTLAGVVLGMVISYYAEPIRRGFQWISGVDPFNPELYYLSRLPSEIDVNQTFWIVLMSIGLSFLATLYPSWKAARLDPVEALRYE
ncbi:MAG: lipoprotein-releasing ABC transporter permease subunit [Rhizobiales bacterium]|nr:lipoprotein-releasing ABC transporter permease subunit [Hyphomicrobiales bacterium]